MLTFKETRKQTLAKEASSEAATMSGETQTVATADVKQSAAINGSVTVAETVD